MERSELMIAIGERIRNGRRRKKLSQTALGKLVDLSMNGLAQIERGEVDPRVGTLVKIGEVLGDDFTYIITGNRTLRVIAEMSESELEALYRAFQQEIQQRAESEIEAIERGK